MRPHRPNDFGAGGLFDDQPQQGEVLMSEGTRPQLLFVCTANISRSPYAELLARYLLGSDSSWTVVSAGVPGTQGRVMDSQMSSLAQRRGVPAWWCRDHRSQPIDIQLLRRSSVIVTMSKRQRDEVLDLEPRVHSRLFTCHQVGAASRLASRSTFTPDINADAAKVLHAYAPVASRRHDVPDPYLKPWNVADEAATQIDTHVGTLITFLKSVCQAAC